MSGGRFGHALAFDSEDDAVRLPYRDTLPLYTKDFTVSLWFRHTAAQGRQPLLWMGGLGPNQPHVALVVEPVPGRVRAEVVTRAVSSQASAHVASRSLAVPGKRGDGDWHHVVLRRGGGELTLTVDGRSERARGVAGSVSRVSPFGVHLGQRMDSRAYFTGMLDAVRVYDRAVPRRRLTDRGGPHRGLLTALPLNHVRQQRR